MKITPKNIKKFQMGGPVGPEGVPAEAPMEEAPVEGGMMPEEAGPAPLEDPIMMLAQMSAQALLTQDCNIAMQVCQAFIQIVQQMQGAPAEAPQGEPVFRKGGILVRRIKK